MDSTSSVDFFFFHLILKIQNWENSIHYHE